VRVPHQRARGLEQTSHSHSDTIEFLSIIIAIAASFSPFLGGNGRKRSGWNYPAVVPESAHRWLWRSVTKKEGTNSAEFENKGTGSRSGEDLIEGVILQYADDGIIST